MVAIIMCAPTCTCLLMVKEYNVILLMTCVFSPCIVREGRLEVVKYLIEVQGCSAGCTDNRGQTPLHHACV